MDLETFTTSFRDPSPPLVNDYQLALWHDAKGDWERSHEIIQDIKTREAAHIHAYLHRKEGDVWNADYWYARAGRKRPSHSFEQEWEELVQLYAEV